MQFQQHDNDHHRRQQHGNFGEEVTKVFLSNSANHNDQKRLAKYVEKWGFKNKKHTFLPNAKRKHDFI